MRAQSTAIPGAVSALLALFARLEPTVQVVDGPPLDDANLENEAVVVGYGQPSAFSWTRSAPDLQGRCTEKGDIVCVITIYSGDEGAMATVRDRCAEILSGLDLALREEPTLGGAVDEAAIGEAAEWTQSQTSKGALCAVAFTVEYEAYI